MYYTKIKKLLKTIFKKISFENKVINFIDKKKTQKK
jgi:hypothetical protein